MYNVLRENALCMHCQKKSQLHMGVTKSKNFPSRVKKCETSELLSVVGSSETYSFHDVYPKSD